MYVITWEYAVRTDHVAEFENTYSSNGTWAELFSRAEGYLGTELLRDLNQPRRWGIACRGMPRSSRRSC